MIFTNWQFDLNLSEFIEYISNIKTFIIVKYVNEKSFVSTNKGKLMPQTALMTLRCMQQFLMNI